MKRMSRSGIGTTSGFGLGAFSRDELDSIHYATLQIFQDTGIKVKMAMKQQNWEPFSIRILMDMGFVLWRSWIKALCFRQEVRSTLGWSLKKSTLSK